jgi:hypothetical protein
LVSITARPTPMARRARVTTPPGNATLAIMADLIITNGDAAADLLGAAGRQGTILPWRDVLHEGPIVAGALEACSAARVGYLAQRFHLDAEALTAQFAERDRLLRGAAGFDRIELWFEHDLYDQLQLLQVLAALADSGRSDGVTLVQADDFLGAQRASTILRFAARARRIADADLAAAREVWSELTQSTPQAIAARAAAPPGRFPYLRAALRRFLEELPAPVSGLSRTEAAILADIADGIAAPRELFAGIIRQEEAAFMGDWSFYRLIDDLAFAAVPLIAGLAPWRPGADDSRYTEAALELTMIGEEVLDGEEDRIALSGIERWWGGTLLSGRAVWRYDRQAHKLVAPETASG